jgi:hypothetical protein
VTDLDRLASLAEAALLRPVQRGGVLITAQESKQLADGVLALVGRVRSLEAALDKIARIPHNVPTLPSATSIALAALDVDPPPAEETDSGGERNARPCESA